MLVRDIFSEATQIWSKSGSKSVRKYRCTSGVRKGRVMSSPSACNKPLNVHKSAAFKQTRSKKSKQAAYKSSLTKRSNPGAIRTKSLNKNSQRVKPRKSHNRVRRIK